MLSTDPATGERSPGTMAHETRQTLADIGTARVGRGVPRARGQDQRAAYDLLEFDNMNAVYRQFFPQDPPARTTCGVQLSAGMKIEIECIALAG